MTRILTIGMAVLAPVMALVAAPALAQRTDINVGMVLEPPNLDPTSGAAAAIREVTYSNIFEGLTRFGPDGSVNPGLAHSWDISDDGLAYTFHLREGVSFHDGTPMTASDVVFTLDRARGEGSTNAQPQLFAGIDTVQALDDLTVQVTLSQPQGAFLFNMAWGDAVIMSPASVETNATNPVGTGAFRFVRWVQGDRVELERNPDYWGEAPALERVTFRFISDPSAAFAAVMAGDVDAFPNFPAPETVAQLDADPRFNVIVGSTEGETILSMNHENEALADIRVRQAIAHAINRQDIIDGAMFGYGTPIGTHFAPHNPDYLDLTDLTPHDPARARELLAEAGHEGLSLRLALPPPTYARRGGEIVAAQLREVGIQTEITNVEWAQWLEQVFRGGDYDLTIVSHTEPMDIGIYARPDYYFRYDSPEFQALIAELDVTADPGERTALLHAAQRHIAEDFVVGFMFQLPKTGVAHADLAGLWENAPVPANDMTGVRWTN